MRTGTSKVTRGEMMKWPCGAAAQATEAVRWEGGGALACWHGGPADRRGIPPLEDRSCLAARPAPASHGFRHQPADEAGPSHPAPPHLHHPLLKHEVVAAVAEAHAQPGLAGLGVLAGGHLKGGEREGYTIIGRVSAAASSLRVQGRRQKVGSCRQLVHATPTGAAAPPAPATAALTR